jgi:CRISPR-associated protein Cas2
MTLFIICYDIPDDRRRNRVAGLLEGYGDRVQKSVFECHLDRRREQLLRQSLQALVEPTEDKLRYYPLCDKDRELALAWDRAGITHPRFLWLV